jgi:hypothetical protein
MRMETESWGPGSIRKGVVAASDNLRAFGRFRLGGGLPVTGRYGPNSNQVQWVLSRFEGMSIEDWRALAGLTRDAESDERLHEAIAAVKRQGASELVQAVFSLADSVAEAATQASQRLRGDLRALEIPISASGWTGEVEGTRLEFLAPEDRYPFRQAARDVLMLAAMRPYGSVEDFGNLWSPFEPLVGLLKAEEDGVVAGCPERMRLPRPPGH